MDHSAIELTEAACFADAVEMLVACYYVFNVEYAYHLKPMYDVLESLLKIKSPKSVAAKELLKAVKSS